MMAALRTGIPSAGIFLGPLAWLINTQLNYALVPWICAHQVRLVPVVSVAAALVSLVGGLLSWRAFRLSPITPPSDSTGAGRPHRFTALAGMAIAALFTAVIVLQGVAGLMFHGCER
ncbi:hypothetical protein [Microvirga sp. TS319]|uniref:hypothetical protein n=1 Tax=Microvirga sp. TS319 TaxID=3241165 RepID=UPI003519F29A